MRLFGFVAALALFVTSLSANAMRVDHIYVKQELEKRLNLAPQPTGMADTTIASKDCRIRIIDGSALKNVGGDQAALQVVKGEKTLSFFISDRMTYDVSLGGVLDLVSQKRSGLVKHSTLLKLSATKLMITRLSLYPNSNDPTDQTYSLVCSL